MNIEIADTLVSSGVVVLIVVDSMEALVPRTEIDGEMDAAHVGLRARQCLKHCENYKDSHKKKTVILFINQIRDIQVYRVFCVFFAISLAIYKYQPYFRIFCDN